MIPVPTYDEFIQTVIKCTKDHRDVSEWDIRENGLIEIRWIVGGMEGGSCWNDGANERISPEPAKTIDSVMDLIFEAVCPDIKFMMYRRIMRELECEPTKDTANDYYGNYTEYHKITVDLGRLYDLMIENRLLDQQ